MIDKTQILQKCSVRFAKTGPAIYHSHHDMIRFWERAVRRARLPMRQTQGFNPRPRMVFIHALGLGVTSRHEEIELEFYTTITLNEVVKNLSMACAGVLSIISATELPSAKRSRQIRESSYRLTGWPQAAADKLAAAPAKILAHKEINVTRGPAGEHRNANIRPFLKRLAFDSATLTVEADFIHTPTGSARLDEVAQLFAAEAGIDWRGIALEKTGMVVE